MLEVCLIFILNILFYYCQEFLNYNPSNSPMATASDGSQPTATPAATETAPTETPSLDAQGALIAKQEIETPKLLDKVILGADSYVEKFADGKIFVTTAGIKEQISKPLNQIFLK